VKKLKYKERDELVADLRELANLVEERGVKLPLEMPYFALRISQRFYEDSDGLSPREQLAKAARLLPGKVEKKAVYDDFEIHWKTKNGKCELVFETAQKNVCVKRVTGTEQVPKKVWVEIPGEFETREVYEWECHDPLLK
jgi:hypothetical protein